MIYQNIRMYLRHAITFHRTTNFSHLKSIKRLKLTLMICIHIVTTNALADSETSHVADKIMVFGHDESSSLYDMVPSVTKLSGDKLLQVRATSLGDTLKNEVGIASSSYGPSAGRPVIRGLDGDRIRILQNGIGVLDASGASQDHAIPIDPLMMDSVEIVRGPLSLLYGSSALGGVVNILTNRTHSDFQDGFHGAVDSQLSSMDNGKTIGTKIDYGKNRWMFHVDGNYRKTQDLKINGFARSARKRELDPLPLDQETRDHLTNSANETQSGAVGTTYVGDENIIGVSASIFANEYGVVADPQTRIKMEQSRFDLASEWKNWQLFKTIRLKSAQSIYKHREIENGIIGTLFKNNGNETRLEFVQHKAGALSGLVGFQSNIFRFSALGDEAFLPETLNSAQALFAFEEFSFDKDKINIGARAEGQHIRPYADSKFTLQQSRSFFLGSLALGYLHNLNASWSVSSQISYNERAPNYQELFASGAHMATFTYQVGNSNLSKEKAQALDLSLRYQTDKVRFAMSAFGQKFHDYIFLAPTGTFDDTNNSGIAGDSSDDLPIYNYTSKNAFLYGLELDFHYNDILQTFSGRTDIYIKADYLRGRNVTDHTNLPRITPPRTTLGLSYSYGDCIYDLELQRVFAQNIVAPNELPTDGYNQVNLGAIYKYTVGLQQLSFFARVNNLFNVEARNHVSILKDISQLGGRNFSAGIRAYF